LTLEAVPLEELVARGTFVADRTVGTCTTICLVGAVWVVVVGVVVTPFGAVVVVTGRVVVVERNDSWRRGAELDVVVRVKTRINRRSGLDQITQCVLLRDWKGLILVLAG
jgi:hypothetical protein